MASQNQTDSSDVPLYFAYKRTSEHEGYLETFHSHQGIEILLIHRGNGTMVVNHKRYEITPGMLCVFQPYQLHHLQLNYSDNEPFERSIATFEPTMFEAYFEQWPGLHAFYKHIYLSRLAFPCLYGLGDAIELSNVFHSMEERIGFLNKKDQIEEISLFLVALFRALKPVWQKREGQAVPSDSRKTHQAERILKWIESHYTEPFRLEMMAKDLHLSPYHLSHLFKEAIGISITEYIAARRVHQAVMLLTATSKPISLIAEEIGITNSSYFCSFFKAQMGITPHQYRKRWRR